MDNRNKWLMIMGAGVAALVLLAAGLLIGSGTQSGSFFGHHPGGMMGGNFGSAVGMHGFGGAWLLVLIGVAVIGGLGLLAAPLGGRETGSSGVGENPLDIAKRRLAQGEIDQAEYEQIKEALNA